MKALVLEAQGKLVYTEDHPIPAAPDERPTALIKVAACGICGSDLPRGFGGKAYFYPLVMGHEFSGVVEEPVPGGRWRRAWGNLGAMRGRNSSRSCRPVYSVSL